MHSYQLHTSTHKQSTEPSEDQAKDPGTTDAQREALQKPKTTQTFGPRWAWRGRPPWRQQGRAAKGLSHPTQDASTLLDLGRKGPSRQAGPMPAVPLCHAQVLTSFSSPFRRRSYSLICPSCFSAVSTLERETPEPRSSRPAEAAPPEASRGMQAHPRRASHPGILPVAGPCLTSGMCASGAPSHCPACREPVPVRSSLCVRTPRSAASVPLPW